MLKKVSMTFLLLPSGCENKHFGGPSQIRQMADFSWQRAVSDFPTFRKGVCVSGVRESDKVRNGEKGSF